MDCGELKYQHDDEGMDLEGIQDINEAFEDQVEEITFRNHQKELAVKYRGYALAFIEHAGSSLLQVAQYLSLHPASEDPDYQLTATILSVTENTALLSDKELKHVSLIDQALMLEFKLGMVDIFPPGCKTLITDLISACSLGVKHEATDRKRFWDLGPQALDTYINLDCLLCYRHECSEHGKLLVADDEESIIQRFSGPTYTELVSLAPELELPSHRKGRSAALLEALPSLPMKMLQSIGQKRESSTLVGPCSEECHRNQKIPSRCYLEKAREWSKGEEDLLLMSLAIYGGDTDAEWVCLLSAVTGRECIEVFKQGTKYNRPAVKDSPQPNRPRLMTHSEMKEKTVTGSHLERFGFQPCFHTGLCVQNKCDLEGVVAGEDRKETREYVRAVAANALI
ncbi:MAG: hypothetical protein M1814_002134 [Vezdaea aestivalis]|nr:MAG: hypothetical protein M1814_002134 [Vezdaea aestivalis]